MNLFENLYEEKKPLAFRYRPKTLEDFYGQEKLVGEKGILKRIIEKGTFMNSIFWGAPGIGKTTLAEIRSESTRLNSSHHRISYAVFCLKKKTYPIQIRGFLLRRP